MTYFMWTNLLMLSVFSTAPLRLVFHTGWSRPNPPHDRKNLAESSRTCPTRLESCAFSEHFCTSCHDSKIFGYNSRKCPLLRLRTTNPYSWVPLRTPSSTCARCWKSAGTARIMDVHIYEVKWANALTGSFDEHGGYGCACEFTGDSWHSCSGVPTMVRMTCKLKLLEF